MCWFLRWRHKGEGLSKCRTLCLVSTPTVAMLWSISAHVAHVKAFQEHHELLASLPVTFEPSSIQLLAFYYMGLWQQGMTCCLVSDKQHTHNRSKLYTGSWDGQSSFRVNTRCRTEASCRATLSHYTQMTNLSPPIPQTLCSNTRWVNIYYQLRTTNKQIT